MPLIEQLNETQLKGLKYSDFGSKKPLITKDHTKKPFVDKLGLQASQRIDDLARLTKLMASGPGLKFQANQALLQQGDTLKDLKKGVKSGFKNFDVKKLKDKAVDTLKNNAMATVSILAQVPVNGTGTHFINNGGATYLQQGGNAEPGTGFGDFLRNATGAGVGQVDGASTVLNGGIVEGVVDDNAVIEERMLASRLSRAEELASKKASQESKDAIAKMASTPPPPSLGAAFNTPSVSPFQKKLGGFSPIQKTVLKNNNPDLQTPNLKVDTSTYIRKGEVIDGSLTPQYNPLPENDINFSGSYSSDTVIVNETLTVENQDGTKKPKESKLAPKFDSKLSGANNPLHDDVENVPEYLHLKKQGDADSAYRPYTTSELNIHYGKYKLPDLGRKEIESFTADDKVDKLNASISGAGYGDLIPFSFTSRTPEKIRTLQFRAFLDDLSDNYSGEWQGTRYVGRGEEFYTYQGFKRDISFNFKVAALSQPELIPMYNRLNHLVGTTAPSYNGDGKFMRGTLTTINVGHFFYNLTGFISSVNLTWDKTYPWEIDVDSLGLQRLPHILNVAVQFTPIHDFNPKSDLDYPAEKYIGWRGEVNKTTKNTRKPSSGKKPGKSRGPSSSIQNVTKG